MALSILKNQTKKNNIAKTPLDIAIQNNPRYFKPKHLRYIEKKLLALLKGKYNNLVISQPPRTGKSELSIVAFAIHLINYYWDKYPVKIAIVSYSTDFSASHVRAISNFFKAFAPEMIGDKDTQTELVFSNGSVVLGTSKDGILTGKEVNFALVDDLIKNAEQSFSPTVRAKTIEWYEGVLETRMQGFKVGKKKIPPKTLFVGTIWSPEDLIVRIPEKYPDKWEIIRLAAIAEKGDPFRKPGESIFPELFSVDEFLDKKEKVGPLVWQNQYCSNALGKFGNYLDPNKLHRGYPRGGYARQHYCISCDPGLTKGGDDTAIFVTTKLTNGAFFIEEIHYGKWEAPETQQRLANLYLKYQGFNPTLVMEGISFMRLLAQPLLDAGIPVHLIKSRGNKMARLMNLVPWAEQDRLYFSNEIPQDTWDYFETQWIQFNPENRNGKDDLLDALETGISQLGTGGDFYSQEGPGLFRNKDGSGYHYSAPKTTGSSVYGFSQSSQSILNQPRRRSNEPGMKRRY